MPRIVHLVIGVHDLARAAHTYGALGFNLTPIGAHPFGTRHRLALFADNVLELLAMRITELNPAAFAVRFPGVAARWHIRRALVRSIKWLIARHRRARGRQRLATFSDRMLRDIGADRSMVVPDSTSAFWRLR